MKARRRGGFTIVELLTVLAILSLLMALLAPAVQQARESARSLTCKSRLRGLVTAVLQYEGVHGMFPKCSYTGVAVFSPAATPAAGELTGAAPSVLTQVLPYIGGENLYSQINFDVTFHSALGITIQPHFEITRTARSLRMAAFLCPADGKAQANPGATNYRACVGVGPCWHRTATFPDSDNGAFAYYVRPTQQSMIVDGMAFTAAFSERLVGSGIALEKPTSRDAYLQSGIEWLEIFTANDQLRVCASMGTAGHFDTYWSMGSSWLTSGQDNTIYTHAMSPNSSVIDCIFQASTIPDGAASARSMHPQKVNVAYLDGGVRSVSNSISLPVWRALATRDGGETVLGSEF